MAVSKIQLFEFVYIVYNYYINPLNRVG